MSKVARSFLEWLLPLYRNLDFAYTLAALMTSVAAVLIALAVIGHVTRTIALQDRLLRISRFISFGSRKSSDQPIDEREEQFTTRFSDIDASMSGGGLFAGKLAHAWRRYRKTLTFVGAPPIRSTQRPNSFFYSACPPPTWLGFSANLFVAFGLLATFLGLVAALTFAAQGMASDDTSAMQKALRDLLSAAASKFVTSIAGVGLSIFLRLTERLLTMDLRGRLDRLSSAVELGVRVDNDAHSAAVSERIAQLVERIDRAVGGEPRAPT